MKFLLLCTAAVLLASGVESARPKYKKRNTLAQIYAEFNITIVAEKLLYLYFGDIEVYPGQQLPPLVAVEVPTIYFDYDPGCYYLFFCSNKDWPNPDNPYLADSLIGMYANLYGDGKKGIAITDSCIVADWIGPSPTPGTRPHRYVCYVYKQSGFIDTTQPGIANLQIDRLGFKPKAFADEYDLGYPIASNFFTSAACD